MCTSNDDSNVTDSINNDTNTTSEFSDEEVATFAEGLGITTEAVYQALSELTDLKQREDWYDWWVRNNMPSTEVEFIAATMVFENPMEFAKHLIEERNLFRADQLFAKVVITLNGLMTGFVARDGEAA
jgi:hypothetical protein